MYEKYLVEILLSVVLMFNVGAYTFLWHKIRNLEDGRIDNLEKEITDTKEIVNSIWRRIFGHDDDSTMEGHLVETDRRFDHIDNKLDIISQTMKEMSESRREEHSQVQNNFQELIDVLSDEENLDFDRKSIDFEIDRKL